MLGGWLLPAAEPYRTSRRVGERLARLVEQTGIKPILLNYQEPGVIYAMGRPVPNVGEFGGVIKALDRGNRSSPSDAVRGPGLPRPARARGEPG